ncbi:MAG: DNA-processing protein DprA [Planctomycetota bacterium]
MPVSPVCSELAEKYLQLHLCEGVGPIRAANLLSELGDIDAVLAATRGDLLRVNKIGEKVASQITRDRSADRVAEEIEIAGKHDVRILCIADPDYPVALKNIPDPPLCLYVRGSLQKEDALALGIVGSRHCSRYGAEQAERLAALATNAGLVIVSGMARGIDTCAHHGALLAGGRTLAVLGCGLCHLYPPDAIELAERIIKSGAILSELPMRIAPDPQNFPPRNRIIAGLSLGVLVVEAARRSGALITARLATEYNREVFALPGRVDGPYAEGCNDLIKSGGAKLVTNLSDILDELGDVGRSLAPLAVTSTPTEDKLSPPTQLPLDEYERSILAALGPEPLPVDAVCELSMLPPSKVAAVLTSLQLKGVVRRVGANLYELVCRA